LFAGAAQAEVAPDVAHQSASQQIDRASAASMSCSSRAVALDERQLEVRDPFRPASGFSFSFKEDVPAQQPEVWPSGDSQSALRWSQQATEGIHQKLQHECVLQDDPPFVAVAQPSNASVVYDDCGNRVIWPWEDESRNTSNVLRRQKFVQLPQLPPHRTDDLIQKGLNASTASGSMGRNTSGVRAWHMFCQAEQISPNRALDPNSPLESKLLEEQLCMRFCAALVQDRGIQPKTVQTYFGQVQGWHSKANGLKLCAGLKLSRLPAMVKGLKRIFGEQPREVRRGIAPQALRKAFDKMLDPSIPLHANIRAALALALQGLLRGAEFALDEGKQVSFDLTLSRADVRVCTDKMMVIMMRPCKNMRHLSGKTVPLAIGAGGTFIDAVWEMNNLLRIDPVSESQKSATPLFRDPQSNDVLRTGYMRQITRMLMQSVGEDPKQFGLHSFRIGGATALFAAGANPITIRMMGRWSSDCYRLYVRACYEQTLAWTARCGSTQVHDFAGEFGQEADYY
jgi:hypothetical protein